MNRLLNVVSKLSEQGHSAFRALFAFFVASLISAGYIIFQVVQAPTWQMWVETGGVAVLLGVEIYSISLALGGRHERGVWLTFGTWLIGVVVTSAIIANVGIALLISALIIVALAVSQSLPPRQAINLMIFGAIAGVAALLLDIFLTTERISVTGFQTLVVVLTIGLTLALGSNIALHFNNYLLRTKLIVSFVVVTLFAVGALSYINVQSLTSTLTANEEDALLSSAKQAALAVDNFIADTKSTIYTEAQIADFAIFLDTPADQRDARLILETTNSLKSLLTRDEKNISAAALLDAKGLDVLDTDIGDLNKDKSDRDFFIQPMKTGKAYASNVEISTLTNAQSIYFSAPVRDANGKIVGVLRIRYNASVLQQIIAQMNGLSGTNSFAVLLDENHYRRLAHSTAPELNFKLVTPPDEEARKQLVAAAFLHDLPIDQISTNLPDFENGLKTVDTGNPHFTAQLVATASLIDAGSVARLKNQPWIVAYLEPQVDFLAPVQSQTRNSLLLAAVVALLAAFAAFFLAQTLSNPIARLTVVAEQVAAGDFNAQAKVESADEIGTLATSFNSMTAQLRRSIADLDKRASQLATVAEVGTATATVLETDKLLQQVVDLTKDRFNLYHAHIYLLDESGENLVLASGAGEPGRQMVLEGRSIPLNREQSLVARSAREKKGVTVNDVTQDPNFLPNLLLPNTRSELAVPMIVGGNVIGVFDIQSDEVGRFTDADINIQTTLAAQVATSIQNVRSFEQSKTQADLESLVNVIGQRIQRSDSINETLQIAARELGLALGSQRVSVQIQQSEKVTAEKMGA